MNQNMDKKETLLNKINFIEEELNSFDKEKEETKLIIDSTKKSIINEVKSGSFDEMLNEIEERNKTKPKKESVLDKLFKLF